jgi:hypothetical protein
MMWRLAPVVMMSCVCLALPAPSRAFDQLAGKERIGVRAGWLTANDGFKDAYGNGWDLTLFFTERVTHHFLIDVRLGAQYMGDLKLETLDDEITHQTGIQGAMRILFVSVGPMIGTSIGGPYSMHASAGAGIYSISMVFSNALTPFDLSDQKLGFNGELGLARRIAGNWSLEGAVAAHYILTGDTPNDFYFAFTDGADKPLLLDATLGLVLDLR